MVIKDLLKSATSIIKESNSATPQLDAMVLLCYVLNCDKVYIMINDNKEVSVDAEIKYFNLVEKRKNNMPIAYIINSQEFMSLDFYVDENVLIPRPDTEVLVEHILNSTAKKDKILDLCCGSGCIGISLSYYLKNVNVHLADISDFALEIAKNNAKKILGKNFDINCFKIDILNETPEEKYDIIASNPPYIDSLTLSELDSNVIDYEPKLALFGGDDGLLFYNRISSIAPLILNKDGMLIFEIGENQGSDVADIMRKNGFKDIKIINDLAGKNRVIEGRI